MSKCIADLQRAGSGLRPSRVASVLDENGVLCVSAAEQSQRWRHHFFAVLNVSSSFSAGVLDNIPQCTVAEGFTQPPTLQEIKTELSHLRAGKAARASSILPELLKYGG